MLTLLNVCVPSCQKGPSLRIVNSKKLSFYKAAPNFLEFAFYVKLYTLYIDLYIYTSIHKIKQFVLLNYVFITFSFKTNTYILRSRDLDFDLELQFWKNPYIYISSTCIPNFIKIDPRKL